VDQVTFDLNTYKTIQSIVDAFNSTGKYTATALTSKPKEDLSMDLDAVATPVTIKASAATFSSDLKAIVDGINKSSGYVTASEVVDAAGTAVTNSAAWTYLTGGSDGATPISTDWDDVLNVLATLKIDLILPLTSSASLISLVDAHCRFMSGPSGKAERRCFAGGPLLSWGSEANRLSSIAALIAQSKALNSDRVMLTGLGCKQYDPNGNVKTYPPYITAAMYCGIAGGSSPVEPLTRKYLRCLGLEVNLRVSEIEQLLETNGVAIPIPDAVRGAGYVISRQLTCWNQNDDLYRIEFSVGRGADYIAREIRNRHEDIVGSAGTELVDVTIVNITNAVLEAAKREGYIRNYNPKATQLRVDGTIRYVDYYAEPILPINWIFSTYHLQPTKFTIGI
jgi:ribosomal protein S8